ncbi:MAG: hypothetical protein WBA93_10380 [Microcoleaceae cyanobacterium]
MTNVIVLLGVRVNILPENLEICRASAGKIISSFCQRRKISSPISQGAVID